MDNFLNKLNRRWLCAACVMVAFSGGAEAAAPRSIAGVLPVKRITQTIDDKATVTLAGNRPPVLQISRDNGKINDNARFSKLIMVLKPGADQQKALENFTQAQLNPKTPEYHQWLTPAEFQSHFGVADADLQTLSQYLTDHGFTVDEIPAGGRLIAFSGTAGLIQSAFHTEIHQYSLNGATHIANAGDPQIPAALSDVVGGIVGLHDYHSQSTPKPVAVVGPAGPPALQPGNNPAIDSVLYAVPDYKSAAGCNAGSAINCLYPGDYGVIYDINPLYSAGITGSGVTIAVMGRTEIKTADLAQFRAITSLPTNPVTEVYPNGSVSIVGADQPESTLDLEWSGAIAYQANIDFVTSPGGTIYVGGLGYYSLDGISYSSYYTVSNNIADIISVSYGSCEANQGAGGNSFWNAVWQQAAAQGTTVLVASGDSGAAGCDAASSTTASHGAAVNGICSTPYSTCVGGTQFNDTANPSQYWASANTAATTPPGPANALSYIPEQVWNQSGAVSGGNELWSSGGGQSVYYGKPGWQVANGVPADGARDVPDMALTAAGHDGYMIYLNGQIQVYMGTSLAPPSFAGMMALAVQYNGGRQGNINANLYGLSQLQSSNGYKVFHPTPSGNNSVPGQTGFSAGGTAYNLATGLGSVDANLLALHWLDYSNISNAGVQEALAYMNDMLIIPVASTVSLSSSAATLVAGQAVTLTAAVTGDSPTGTVQFMNNGSALGSPASLSNGVATLTTAGLTGIGSDAVTAVYSGDSGNLPGTSNVLTESVLSATTTTLASSSNSIFSGGSLTLTATVTGDNPTGTVQFYVNGVALGAAVGLSGGVARLTTNSVTALGVDSITAVYSGDSLNAGDTSPPLRETVLALIPDKAPALPQWAELLLAGALLITVAKRAITLNKHSK